jgi:hypothetical protein
MAIVYCPLCKTDHEQVIERNKETINGVEVEFEVSRCESKPEFQFETQEQFEKNCNAYAEAMVKGAADESRNT